MAIRHRLACVLAKKIRASKEARIGRLSCLHHAAMIDEKALHQMLADVAANCLERGETDSLSQCLMCPRRTHALDEVRRHALDARVLCRREQTE